jgi:apolipoprotein D and lipocalin family protein
MKAGVVWAPLLSLVGCSGYPSGVKPVDGFELDRYLGKWYEIARLDHRFERGLSQVTAEYSLNDDGTVKVVNRGFRADRGEWKEAVGKAKFADSSEQGYLKVSFFGPFYASYVIFELDERYEYAFISGPNTGYLWLLSRSPDRNRSVVDRFVAKAEAAGFRVDDLIMVDH